MALALQSSRIYFQPYLPSSTITSLHCDYIKLFETSQIYEVFPHYYLNCILFLETRVYELKNVDAMLTNEYRLCRSTAIILSEYFLPQTKVSVPSMLSF